MNTKCLAFSDLLAALLRASVMIVLPALLLAPMARVYAQVAGGFDLSWASVAGGGGSSSGGSFDLGGTAGQPLTGSSSGGSYSLDSGFWVAAQSAPIPTLTGTGTATAISTLTPTATAVSQTALTGHVTWQGPPAQPNTRQQLPITLTLCVGGAPVSYGAITDASGFFTVTTNLPGGAYNWRAKGPMYLATAGTLVLSGSGTGQVEVGTQRAGDTDNTHNNVVNTSDFIALKAVFGTSSAAGDLNNDGVTNTLDFTLLKGNFGIEGAVMSCP
jgi:hypothetical protein